MSDTRSRISELSAEKRALLALKLKREGRGGAKSAPAETVAAAPEKRYEPFRLSDLQHAYWLGRTTAFALGNLASKAYVEVLCPSLDIERFTAAWREVIQRHDMLRLVVGNDGMQRVLEQAPPCEIPVHDLTGTDPAARAAELAAIQKSMLTDPSPPEEWPQTRIAVSVAPDTETRLHFCFDLLNVDAGSIGIVMREVATSYEGGDLTSPPTFGFRDYAEALDRRRESEDYRRARDYWVQRAPGFPSGPQLPLACDPAAIVRPDFRRCERHLPAATWSALKARVTRLGMTPNSLLLTTYAEVLRAWCRSPHFAINIPLFNRFPFSPEVERIVGPFTTVELLEVDFTERQSFVDRMRRLQEQLIEDLGHREYDGVEFLRELARVKGGAEEAAMPVVFTSLIEGRFNDAFAPFGQIQSAVNQTSQVWMDLHVDEQGGELIVKWDSVEGLFPEGMIDDMLGAYCQLLSELSADDQAWTTSSRSLVPETQLAKRRAINDTAVDRPSLKITDLFEVAATDGAARPALISASETITYGELLTTSRKIGRMLREKGARPDTLVAIVMEKGLPQVQAVMGILQSGAAYLPIDPGLPRERLHYLLDHGRVDLVMTHSHLDTALQWPEGVTRLVFESTPWSDYEGGALEPLGTPSDLAYVLYTSGSTGTPKGAMLEHRNVVNRMLDVIDRFEIKPEDRAIAITALQHDLSVFDLFAMLSSGGAIVIPDEVDSRDPSHWLRLVEQQKVSLWNSVPAFMELFVDYLEETGNGPSAELGSLRSVMLSGDFIPVSLPDRIRALSSTTRVTSLGGPTETTVWDICYPIERVSPEWKSIPYGRPMENSSYHVLDENLDQRPDYSAGELYIGGAGVGRGYWRDEERTKERYVIHPVTGERLYRSGDLGRWLPNGNIEILGRADFQIKLRGLRIEPGEIETVLEQHPRIRTALVMAKGESQRDKRLVAYVEVRQAETGQSPAVVSTSSALDDELASAVGNVIADASERLQFKVERHGLRPDLEAANRISMTGETDPGRLRTHYLSRQSYRSFSSEVVSLESLSETLASLRSYQNDDLPFAKYLYPSGGGLYPVQTYLYVKPGRVAGLDGGTYYYHPADHSLVEIDREARLGPEIVTANNRGPFADAAFMILLVGKLDAVEPLYGNLARDFCLLEAGYMSQLLMMEGAPHLMGFCPLGGVAFSAVRDRLGLPEGYLHLHSLLGGSILAEQAESFSLVQDSGIGSPVGTSGNPADAALREELHGLLSATLPRHMVPEIIIPLERFPLNPNGKLDRRALPEPDSTGPSSREYVAPDSDLEKQVAEIFAEVLEIENVGATDNFFDLGGNSILILKVHLRLKKLLERDFSVVELFANPTVSSLAQALGGSSTTEALAASRSRAEARKAARRGRSRRP